MKEQEEKEVLCISHIDYMVLIRHMENTYTFSRNKDIENWIKMYMHIDPPYLYAHPRRVGRFVEVRKKILDNNHIPFGSYLLQHYISRFSLSTLNKRKNPLNTIIIPLYYMRRKYKDLVLQKTSYLVIELKVSRREAKNKI